MSKKISFLMNLAVVLSMMLALVVVQPVASAVKVDTPPPPKPETPQRDLSGLTPIKEMAAEGALDKIDPLLRTLAEEGGKEDSQHLRQDDRGEFTQDRETARCVSGCLSGRTVGEAV